MNPLHAPPSRFKRLCLPGLTGLTVMLLGASACARALCDYDGDGLCAPLDCDDYDALFQWECPASPSPTAEPSFPPVSEAPSPSPPVFTPPADLCPLYYPDQDQDGYGDPTQGQRSCLPLAGYVDNALDCDDASAASHPGATELPDGLDNDCDGTPDDPPLAYRLHFQARYSDLPDLTVSLWQGLDGTGTVVTSDVNGDIWLLLDGPQLTFSYAYTRQVPALEDAETQVVVVTRLNERLQATTVYETGAALLPTATPTGPYAVGGTIYGVADPYPLLTFRTNRSNDVSRSVNNASIYSVGYAYEYPAPPTYLFITENNSLASGDSPLEGLHYNLAYGPITPTDLTLDRDFDLPLTLAPSNRDARMTQSHHSMTLLLPAGAGTLEFLNGAAALEATTLFAPHLDGPLAGATLRLRAEYWNADNSLKQSAEALWDGQSTVIPLTLPALHTVSPYAPLEGTSLPGTTLQLSGNAGDTAVVQFQEQYSVNLTQPVWTRRWTVYQGDATQPVVFPVLPSGASDWSLITRIPSAVLESMTAESQLMRPAPDAVGGQDISTQTLLTTGLGRQTAGSSGPIPDTRTAAR